MNMKICYVTHLSKLSGAANSLLDLLDALDFNEYEPFVITNSKGALVPELEKRGIRYAIVPYAPATNSEDMVKNIGKRAMNTNTLNFLSVKAIEHVLKKEKIDIVHNNSYLSGAGMEAARNLGIPYICHLRDFIWEDHHRTFINKTLMHELLYDADRVIAVSESVKEKFANISRKEIEVIHDGIKSSEYLLPEREILNGKQINIVLVGRVAPGKGQMDAIRAIRIVSNSTDIPVFLHLCGNIGDKRYFNRMRDYIENHKIGYVTIHDFTNDLTQIRGISDIGLTCSKSEALGRVTVENMLSSMLVIGADTCGTTEIIHDGENGLLYPAGDYHALADVIMQAIEDPENSNKMRAAGYAEAVSYDNKEYARKITEVYRSMIR